MRWPDSHDYQDAIQNPHLCFQDPELMAGEPVVDALGLPQPCSGNNADVYQIRSPGTGLSWAVKCFTRHVPDLRERYTEISTHLRLVARLPFMVDFDYLEQGILVDDEWFPVVKMTWVDGTPLNACVRRFLDKPHALVGLAGLWLKLEQRLGESHVAHADFQHGNVLLVQGQFQGQSRTHLVKLVDYDGMWVPALSWSKPSEKGHPNYQHPIRIATGQYDEQVDRFPNLVIYTALRALAVDGPELWERHDTGDNLLFTRADFDQPAESILLQRLWHRTRDSDLRALAGRLILATQDDLGRVPSLSDLVTGNGLVRPLSKSQQRRAERILSAEDQIGRSTPATSLSPGTNPVPVTQVEPNAGQLPTPYLPESQAPIHRSRWVVGGFLIVLGILLGFLALR